MKRHKITALVLWCIPALCPAQVLPIDLDNDGLPDVWQQQFSAQDEIPSGDPDGDSYTNEQEAIAGTDPFDESDRPKISTELMNSGDDSMVLEFPTKPGKHYQIYETPDLQGFNPLGSTVVGDGLPQYLMFGAELLALVNGNVLHEFWANIAGNNISSLTDLPTFPFKPDGHARLSDLETVPGNASGYGGRMVTFITPPQSGLYSFFLSAGSSAELLLSMDGDPENLVKVAEVLSAQVDIGPSEWDLYESQRSTPINLTLGESYLLQVNYLAHTSGSHCQIAWTGPGLSGTELITADHIAPKDLAPEGVSPSPLFIHDYDEAGQTDALWPNSAIVSAPSGMSGNAEAITADPGNSTAETVLFSASTTEHFYARFLAQIQSGNNNVSLFLQGEVSSQEGPRIELDISSGNPAIRAGGGGGTSERAFVEYGRAYRVEVVTSLTTPFSYNFDQSVRTVAPDTFDIYVSDVLTNELVGEFRELTFRDGGSDIVQSFDRFRLANSSSPNVVFDDFHFTAGSVDGKGILKSNQESMPAMEDRHFFRVEITDSDQDADGLTDWEELALAKHAPYLFFDSETTTGTDDNTSLSNLISGSSGDILFTLQASDTAAFEDNSPNLGVDHGEVIITRSGPLTPVVVKLCIEPIENTGNTATVCDGTCCVLMGTAGDEAAEVDDYQLVDEEGNVIADTVSFDFGEMSKKITVIAIKDTVNEYPETLNLALAEPETDAYTISGTLNGASIQLFDLPDSPSNNAIFTGLFSQDGNAVTPSSGSGSSTAILNGPRTELYLTSEFTNLTSNQQDGHIHKSNAGPAPGAIIYAITNVPGAEGANPPDSDPKIGPLDNYLWDISESSGAVPTAGGAASKQVIIDSLFGQNGETPLYYNVHTVDNSAGEIWSFLQLTGGSITDPGTPEPPAAPGSVEYRQLSGENLELEIRRFLDQATFGATQADVSQLLSTINTVRLGDPSYHRHTAFEAWIDAQIAAQQTYLIEYNLATDFQQLKLRGWFDPVLNPTYTDPNSGVTVETPIVPASWPVVDRSNPDPALWHLGTLFPVNQTHERLASVNDIDGTPTNTNRRHSHWQMMVNAPDQLRQKMGFALQQICVISISAATIRDSPYASSNYQDLLNRYAFSHYRDVLGFVNWSPLMGKWLSSLQNQKGLDVDGDGIDDTSPDENLARENMQLFSIGLFELWPDGTLKLGSDGAPNNTYTNEDIREFAKVLTGQSFSVRDDKPAGWGGIPYQNIPVNDDFDLGQGDSDIFGLKYVYPMIMFGEYHDRSAKTFVGTTIDNTGLTDPTAQGIADLNDAIDWLAGKPGDGQPDFDGVSSHGTTPAFICRRLIQRFTKSNPSREYLHRVASAFKDSEGNLALTIKAILLDPEARVPNFQDESVGLKKSPLEGFIQAIRNLDSVTYIPLTDDLSSYPFDSAPGDFSNPDLFLSNFGYPASQSAGQRLGQRMLMRDTVGGNTTSLGMAPFAQDTVFNWYLPDFAPTGPLSNAGLVSPEMQLADEQSVVRNINQYRLLAVSDNGTSGTSLASSSASQLAAFNGDTTTNNHDNIRVDFAKLVAEIYPSTAPPPTATETSEYLANLEMIDELDRRLMNGQLKKRYPIDPADDGVDGIDQNPRELILTSITYGGNDPFDGNNDLSHRQSRFEDALYLILSSPEYQVRK